VNLDLIESLRDRVRVVLMHREFRQNTSGPQTHMWVFLLIKQLFECVHGSCAERLDATHPSLEGDVSDQRLNAKMDRHFMWLVGIQIATLVAIIGALLRRS